jgi:hypothetical protein
MLRPFQEAAEKPMVVIALQAHAPSFLRTGWGRKEHEYGSRGRCEVDG